MYLNSYMYFSSTQGVPIIEDVLYQSEQKTIPSSTQGSDKWGCTVSIWTLISIVHSVQIHCKWGVHTVPPKNLRDPVVCCYCLQL